MTVFKGYLMMTKRNLGIVLMYFGIFLGIAFLLNAAAQRDSIGMYSSKKLNVAVVDLDKSDLSENLITFLQEKHNVTLEKDDKSKLAEELYYVGQDVVLRIQKGFEKNAAQGTEGIYLTNTPGSYNGIFLEQQINNFVGNVMTYHLAGYSLSEGCKRVMAQKESKVSIEDVNGNGGEIPLYANFLQFFPYICISIFGLVLGKILFIFRQKTVKNRMMASAVSLTKQNVETILAFFILGMVMYLISIVMMVLVYGSSVLTAPNLGWYLFNGFLVVLTSLEIAFLIGLLIKKEVHANSVTTPLSLGLSFLCGVFVPLDVMGAQIKTIAKFLPVYWYETIHNLLTNHAEITGTVRKQVLTGFGVQVLFVFALAGIGLAVAKYQQQEH